MSSDRRVNISIILTIISQLSMVNVHANMHISVSVDGRAQPYLSSQTGTVGVEPITLTYEQTMPGAVASITTDTSFVLITNPLPGAYSVLLHGNYSDRTMVTISIEDEQNNIYEQYEEKIWYHGDDVQFAFTFDPSQNPILSLSRPLETIKNITVQDVGGFVGLSWDVSVDPDLAAYRIYGKREEYPNYQLLSETQSLSHVTGHLVRSDDVGEHWQYIVLGVNAAGEESFSSVASTNILTLNASFISDEITGAAPLAVGFTDISDGAVTSWEWDLDGDGNPDSTAQNPTYTYTQAGYYDVELTVTGPLGTSTKRQNSYISVINDADFDGVSDEDELALGLNPNHVDTDGDGLVDGAGGVVSIGSYATGVDVDHDGYVDGELDTGTSPLLADTDSDGVSDGAELSAGTNPFDSTSFNSLPDGDINNDGFVDVRDLQLAFRILTNLYIPTAHEQARWDVAPLVNGVPQPDQNNNLGDLVVLMRKVLGEITF